MEQPLWERTRRTVRDDIAAAAMALFEEQGFESTTMDEIAARAGVSRRSLFRYFGTKEDIVLRSLTATGEIVAELLRARPAAEGPWEALQAVADEMVAEDTWSDERELAVGRTCLSTPSLRARRSEKHQSWSELLVPLLARRPASAPVGEVAATAILAAGMACLDIATDRWVDGGATTPLPELFAEAVAAVRG
ncbi:TetR family transcriptional regulator [Pseudonocardia ailaonensis]|uniref:TetR family transcriptional regulator n=1 Tax=Pseudonocardia ailaonensis TaxID=367279 RepID=A0ABN2NIQ4_9PSEU